MVEDGISLCCFFCTSLPVFVYSAIKTYFYAKIAICCGNSLITMQNKWEVDFSLASGSSLRRFQKNHAHEYASCLRNLDRVIMLLDDGNSLRSLNRNPSFVQAKALYRIFVGKALELEGTLSAEHGIGWSPPLRRNRRP